MHTLKRFWLSLLLAVTTMVCGAAPTKDFIIVIDPGHGGQDAGCIGKILKEKNLNLSIALRVGELISAHCPNVKVIYTRKTDVFITLMGRTDLANKVGADLFLSIHADAIPRKNRDVEATYGAGTFTLGTARNQANLDVAMRENRAILLEDNYQTRYEGFNPNKPESYIIFEMMQNTHQTQSLEFARAIQNSLVNRGKRNNRDVRQAGFYVLRMAAMPSVLVETGFLSNTKEERWLASNNGQETIAKSIYLGFVDYKKSWDQRNRAEMAAADHPTHPDRDERPDAPTPPPTANPDRTDTPRQQPTHPERQPRPQTPTTPTHQQQPASTQVYYKIQFLSSPHILKKGARELKGLWPVEYYKEGKIYRYTYGKSTSKSDLQRTIIHVRKKFGDAFVVKFDARGNRIK